MTQDLVCFSKPLNVSYRGELGGKLAEKPPNITAENILVLVKLTYLYLLLKHPDNNSN